MHAKIEYIPALPGSSQQMQDIYNSHVTLTTSPITRGVHRTHTPRCHERLQARMHAVHAATIEQAAIAYCVHVWPYPRCGSDRLPYILERWSQML